MLRRSAVAILPGLSLAATLAACASHGSAPVPPARATISVPAPTPEPPRANSPAFNPPAGRGSTSAVQRALGKYKVGKPYQVAGVWYVPAEQPDYDAVGTASWYGDAFHGRPTANGEAFDMTLASAAHPTLPLPSLVEVTNLENDRAIQVRVNDRGPFKPGRIIDVSREAADQLGFRHKGVTQVRVRYVGPASLDPFLRQPSASPPAVLALTPSASTVLTASAPLTAGSTTMSTPGPNTDLRPSPEPTFSVQAGAFANRGNAERAAAALVAVGPTQVREASQGQGVLYRVLVGAWTARDGAAQAVEAVAKAGFPDARIVTAS